MSGAIPPLPQYAFMAWHSVEVQIKLCLVIYYTLFILWYSTRGSHISRWSYYCNRFLGYLTTPIQQERLYNVHWNVGVY